MPPKLSAGEQPQAGSGSGSGSRAAPRSGLNRSQRLPPHALKIAYYQELETIRREKPIVDPKYAAAPIKTVGIWSRPEISTKQPGVTISLDDDDDVVETRKKPEVTTISSDDNDDVVEIVPTSKIKPLPLKRITGFPPPPRNQATPKTPPETTTWKIGGANKRKACDFIDLSDLSDLSDSDNDDDMLKKLRRSSPHNFADIRRKLGYRRSIDDHFGRYKLAATRNFNDRYNSRSKPTSTNPIADPDQATMLANFDWSGFFKNHYQYFKNSQCPPPVLYKGFPMIEEVVFLMHPNSWTEESRDGKHMDSGHCYWASIALLVYGSASYWLLVKAEHLWYLETILGNRHHPRHEFYKKMMNTRFDSKSCGTPGSAMKHGRFNLWEALQIPGLWVNQDPCHLTADLYGLYLVLYKYDGTEREDWVGKVYDMKTYGTYNSRHIFLCYAVCLSTLLCHLQVRET